eukprot:scaffold15611_cov110-Isochrysis_galbana.AAC.8
MALAKSARAASSAESSRASSRAVPSAGDSPPSPMMRCEPPRCEARAAAEVSALEPGNPPADPSGLLMQTAPGPVPRFVPSCDCRARRSCW